MRQASPTRKGRRDDRRTEFGDFQTPPELARAVCRALQGLRPKGVLEPTCGTGTLLAAALNSFPSIERALGVDIHAPHVRAARNAVAASERIGNGRACDARARNGRAQNAAPAVTIRRGDFFQTDWSRTLAALPDPLLVIGNPPWVTNSELGALASGNVPAKSNDDNLRGIEARTGRGNFDLSEWMLRHLLERLAERRATLAMLCKTTVARKVLAHAWKQGWPIRRCEMRSIDAGRHFGAAVEACLLVCEMSQTAGPAECDVYDDLESKQGAARIGWRNGLLLADVGAYERTRHLAAQSPAFQWRSGIKHDCAAVMELRREARGYRNGLGALVTLEDECVFPLLKCSDLAKAARPDARLRYLLVPQQSPADDTRALATRAPAAWKYLLSHGARLDRRASAVYRNRGRFAVFGVGPYSFAPWKVAVSGLHKEPEFVAVGPRQGKPVVFDDASYFHPCAGRRQAEQLAALLNGDVAREFFSAYLFRDAKRPITAELLRRLDLARLEAACARRDGGRRKSSGRRRRRLSASARASATSAARFAAPGGSAE